MARTPTMDSIEIIDETVSSAFFDETIGHIQDIILSEHFQSLQDKFFDEHWQQFEYGDENKLVYTDIFMKYQQLFEYCIHEQLQQRMQNFELQRFAIELEKCNSNEDIHDMDEIHELLQSFTDFMKFKELMLDYRRQKEGLMSHLDSGGILVTKAYLCAKNSYW